MTRARRGGPGSGPGRLRDGNLEPTGSRRATGIRRASESRRMARVTVRVTSLALAARRRRPARPSRRPPARGARRPPRLRVTSRRTPSRRAPALAGSDSARRSGGPGNHHYDHCRITQSVPPLTGTGTVPVPRPDRRTVTNQVCGPGDTSVSDSARDSEVA